MFSSTNFLLLEKSAQFCPFIYSQTVTITILNFLELPEATFFFSDQYLTFTLKSLRSLPLTHQI